MTDSKAGYGRPPKRSQFKPGQSGNPSGRPKQVPSFESELRDELALTVTVTESGRKVEVSKQRAIIKGFIAAAIDGDMRAITALLALSARTPPHDDGNEPSDDEIEIIEAFHRQEHERADTPAASINRDSDSERAADESTT